MATLKEAIYKIIQDDAKLHTGSELGSLLSKYNASPYGVYFMNPPDDITPPMITYFFMGGHGFFVKDIMLCVSAWGTNYEAILNRVRTLLHNAVLAPSDYSVKYIKYDWESSELWDEDLKTYYKQYRFLIKGIVL